MRPVLPLASALVFLAVALGSCGEGAATIERSGVPSSPSAAPHGPAIAAADPVGRAPIEDEPGAVRWSDLLAPVDAFDGSAIADAVVVHVAPTGERHVLPLRAAVQGEHLEEGSLLAVDGDAHEPRFFAPSAVAPSFVAKGAGGPVQVSLLSATRLVIEPFDEWSRAAGPFVVTLRALADGVPDGREEWSRDNPFDASADLRRLVTFDEESDSRRRLLERVHRDRGHSAFIGIDGPPVALQLHRTTTYEVEELPFVVGDLPPGVSLDVEILASEPTTVAFVSPDAEPSSNTHRVSVAGPEPTVVVVRAVGGSRIRAQLPRGATEGTWRLVNERERTNGAFESDGTLVLTRVVPGDCRFWAEWIESDGAFAFVELRFDATEHRVYDIGELSVAGGFELRVVPRVIVDGERDVAVEAAFATNCDWQFRLLLRGAGDFDRVLERLAPVTIRGGAAASGILRGSLRDLAEDDELMYTSRGFEGVRSLDLDGVHEVDLALALERRHVVDFTTTVLPDPSGRRREIAGLLTDDRGSSVHVRFEPFVDTDPTQPWTVRGRASVRGFGTWRLDVAACPRITDDWAGPDFEAPLSWCASRSVVFADEFHVRFGIDLEAASAVVVTASGPLRDDLSDAALFHPRGESTAIVTVHQGFSFGAPNLAVGLLPGVEYVSAGDPDLRFVAPPAGQTLHLEPRAR